MTSSSRSFLILALASLSIAVAGSGCQGSLVHTDAAVTSDAADPSTLVCAAASDCTRTEIDHEILTVADCPCLYGCAFQIVNVTTANRRMAAYQARCTPGKDGHGNACGVDDCIDPPTPACINQVCAIESLPR